jgi:type III secretion protein Q
VFKLGKSGVELARENAVPSATPDARFATIVPRSVEIANAFYRRRAPLETTLAGRRTLISVSWSPAPALDRYEVEFKVDEAVGEVAVSQSLIELLIKSLDPQLVVDGLASEQLAILLELAVSRELEAIEGSLNCTISIAALRRQSWMVGPGFLTTLAAPDASNENTYLHSIYIELATEGTPSSWAELRLPADQAMRLARHFDIVAKPTASDVDLPVAVCLRVAAATFALREIRSLKTGDVVLVDDYCRDAGMGIAVIAEHLVAPVELISEGVRLLADPRLGRGSLWEWSMERAVDEATKVPDTGLDGLPVRLVFELGRTEMSLVEIRRLAPGAIVPLACLRDQAVDIVANGRRIGRGALVEIGDSLGVRVTRLFENE